MVHNFFLAHQLGFCSAAFRSVLPPVAVSGITKMTDVAQMVVGRSTSACGQKKHQMVAFNSCINLNDLFPILIIYELTGTRVFPGA